MRGASFLHGGHQLAKKVTISGRPRKSASDRWLPVRVVPENLGAGERSLVGSRPLNVDWGFLSDDWCSCPHRAIDATRLAAAPKFQALVRQATRHNWVVYSKRPFAGPQQVLAYLSRYTHRVGITNRRLQRLDPASGTLTFDYKDYAEGARHKAMTLSLEQFIGRLCLHVLPPRFVKIRHYGLLSNRGHNRRLEQARALLAQAPPARLPQLSPTLPGPTLPVPGAWPICPHCGWATLVLVRVVQPQRWVAPVAATDSS